MQFKEEASAMSAFKGRSIGKKTERKGGVPFLKQTLDIMQTHSMDGRPGCWPRKVSFESMWATAKCSAGN